MKVIGENEVRIQLKESTGPMGPAGPKGDKGDKGDRGETGPRGLTGEMGPKGDKGDKGERGEKGATGAQGPKGEKGEKGETGATGAQGPKGEKGETGATGPQGPQGIQGEAGPQGEQGPQGEKGEKGDKGDTGPQGPAGSIDNLPIASATQLGGVKAPAATDDMTQQVHVKEDGTMWVPEGGGGESWELINEIELTEETYKVNISTDSDGNAFELKKAIAFCYIYSSGTADKQVMNAGFDGTWRKAAMLRVSSWPRTIIFTADNTMVRRKDTAVIDLDSSGSWYNGYAPSNACLPQAASPFEFYGFTGNIKCFKMFGGTSSVFMAAGCKFKIYGVRV